MARQVRRIKGSLNLVDNELKICATDMRPKAPNDRFQSIMSKFAIHASSAFSDLEVCTPAACVVHLAHNMFS